MKCCNTLLLFVKLAGVFRLRFSINAYISSSMEISFLAPLRCLATNYYYAKHTVYMVYIQYICRYRYAYL